MNRLWSVVLVFAAAAAVSSTIGLASSGQLPRTDFFVSSDPGIRIFVREVRAARADGRKLPILLLHGARVPGIASFDLPVAGGSLAADLAASGRRVFVMDARGYGRSTRPAEMSDPPETHPPLVRSPEVVRDVEAVVEWIRKRTGTPRVDLFGWATGGHWLGLYATLHPGRIAHLILHNTLYAGSDTHRLLGHGTDMEDPTHPGRFNAASYGAYRWNPASSLLGAWDRSIPVEEKAAWRDPAVADAYVRAALDSDPEGRSKNPAAFRSPTGALEDSFYLAIGRQLWDASFIRAPTLVVRSELDFWSRPEDQKRLIEGLVHAPRVRALTIPRATHFVHLDRAEHGRRQFLDEIVAFLNEP